MDKAWIFFLTLMTVYLAATAQQCLRRTCETDCERRKCQNNGTIGTCLRDTLENDFLCTSLGGIFKQRGRGLFCKYYPVCKCCIPALCENGGTWIWPHGCICPEGWNGTYCQDYYCNPKCENGGNCIGPNICNCTEEYHGDICQFPLCENGGIWVSPNGPCICPDGWNGTYCQDYYCNPKCENGGICSGPNICDCTEKYHGDICQYINCFERDNCKTELGTCYAKNNPILNDTAACPQVDNGRKWCSPMCACCFGA